MAETEHIYFASKSNKLGDETYFIWAKSKQDAVEISRSIWPPTGTVWINEVLRSREMMQDPRREGRRIRVPWKKAAHDQFQP